MLTLCIVHTLRDTHHGQTVIQVSEKFELSVNPF
jgi:hypothetical protein